MRAYGVQVLIDALKGIDARLLQTLMMGNATPGVDGAQFQNLAPKRGEDRRIQLLARPAPADRRPEGVNAMTGTEVARSSW